MPIWLAIWTAGAVPGVRCQMRAAIARAVLGSSPRISARAAAKSATASRSVQSGIGRAKPIMTMDAIEIAGVEGGRSGWRPIS